MGNAYFDIPAAPSCGQRGPERWLFPPRSEDWDRPRGQKGKRPTASGGRFPTYDEYERNVGESLWRRERY